MKLNQKINTKFIISLSSLVSISLVLFIAFNANQYLIRMSKNNSELYSAYRISELMKSFKSNIDVLESKQRAYQITGDGKIFETYKLKETETKTYLKSMEKYFSGKPEEEAFYTLKDLTYKKLMEAKDLSHSQNLLGAGSDGIDKGSIQTMTEINNAINLINESLSKTTAVLLNNSVEFVQVSKKWSFLEVAIGILAAIAAVIILFRDINVRNSLENELRIAKKLSDENALMKEQFMANMSHEIRTPMNAILGFSDLMQKTKLDDVQSDYLNAIKTSGSNLLNIINDVLDFSKIEAGKLHIEKISFNILNLLESVKILFVEKAKEKQIDFDVIIDNKIPEYIFGDPTRLTQILINLVSNAIKFTPEGKVSLSCEIKSIEHDIVQLVFRVKDTGIGIPSDKTGDIFERFNQGNKETTRKYGGTGLGLSIVKSLVEIQNGDIRVKSKEGVGTEFIVTISYPISFENQTTNLLQHNHALSKISNNNVCVLLVEDNPLNQKLASTYLAGFGLEVEIAENGMTAIEKLKKETFDLILMDIQMPIMDGYIATQKIRKELGVNIPIIAMTANVMNGEKEKCLRYGMNDYISKPFKEKDLHALISKYLDTKIKHNESRIDDGGNVKNNEHSTKIVDLNELFILARGNNAFIEEIIDIFLKQNPSDLKDIDSGIQKNDFDSVRAAAHRMKTSIGFMGMKQLLPALDSMERMAEKKEKSEELISLFNKIKNDCELACLELQNVIITIEPTIKP